MRVKKAGGKVFGADFTAAERKAMNLEIQRQLAEYDLKHANDLDAIILAEYFDLVKRYEMDEADNIWLNTRKLKEIGVDIESWNKGGEG